MALIIFANVVPALPRPSHSIEWAEEVARHLMIWLTFLGAGRCCASAATSRVENLQDALPRAGARRLRGASSRCCCSPSSASWSWYGVLYMERTQYQTHRRDADLVRLDLRAMPVGGLLLVLHLAAASCGAMSRGACSPPSRLSTPTAKRARSEGPADPMGASLRCSSSSGRACSSPSACRWRSRLACATLAALSLGGTFPLFVVMKEMFTGIDSFPLMAVPFFILAAELMSGGSLTEVLLRFAEPVRRPQARRPGLHQRPVADVLLRHLGLGAGRRRRAGRDDDPHDGQGRLRPRLRRGADRGDRDRRADHPAVDHHDHLRAAGRSVSVGALFMAGFLPGLLIAAAMASSTTASRCAATIAATGRARRCARCCSTRGRRCRR